MSNATASAPPAGFAPKTVAEVLGEIVWLLTQSPSHKQLFIGDLEWFCMPAILLQQFRLFRGATSPAAVALWAFVSAETEQRLVAGGSRLRPDQWKEGEFPWLIELVAPFGGQDEILRDLSSQVFGGRSFKFHRTGPDGRRAVASFPADPPGASTADKSASLPQ